MNKDDFYYLGKVIKAYGNKGHVMVTLDVDDPSAYLNTESVFLDLQGERIPFFIEELELKHNKKAVIRFQDVNSIEDAGIYAGLEMYLPVSQLPPLEGDQFYFHEVKGFRVTDLKHGDIGVIDDILELPHQSLFQIRSGDREILVPIVDEVIIKVDRENRVLEIEAPEGLIEIYL
jgi:16S rRNA processing protein RimM